MVYLGARPGCYQDFSIECHRMTPATPINYNRQAQSAKGR